MSYDYSALVTSITDARRKAASNDRTSRDHLQTAIEGFETLSSHCPMTPLLWIQYSKTMYDFLRAFEVGSEDQATVIRLQTLELGLIEFPSSSLLQIYYSYWLMSSSEPFEKKDEAIKMAIDAVGSGSHRNEGPWTAILFRFQIELYATAPTLNTEQKIGKINESFIRRSRTPMKDVNDTIASEYRECCRQNGFEPDCNVEEMMETGRRMEARLYSSFVSAEDEIDVAMHEEGILGRYFLTQPINGVMPQEWIAELESSSDQKFAMGLGGERTANAFLSYIKMLRISQSAKQKGKALDLDELEESIPDRISHIINQVYERAVAECPTVEKLWISYSYNISNKVNSVVGEPQYSLLTQLQRLIQRACRNCPYSYELAKKQLHALQLSATCRVSVLEPDQLLSTVQNALSKGFLPSNPTVFLGLYLETIRIVKQRILELLTKKTNSKKVAFDDPEELSKGQLSDPELDDKFKEEIGDLIDDVPDMFEEIELRLQESHPTWSEGRALLWKERATSDLLLLQPCKQVFSEKPPFTLPYSTKEKIKSILNEFERCCKVHNPPYPDLYLSYIRQFASCGSWLISNPIAIGRHIRNIRFLFQKAVQSVGPQYSKENLLLFGVRHYSRAISDLCQEWINFEQMFGSERSLSLAEKTISKKMKHVTADPAEESALSQTTITHAEPVASIAEVNTQRKRGHTEGSPSYESSPKKSKRQDPSEKSDTNAKLVSSTVNEADAKSEAPAENDDSLEVKVKKTYHKVHPFTIRVSNLDLSTEDMDLVDIFRPLCGAIVHAKIIRDKQDHGVKPLSKGWGLVQFEEKESAAKALSLNEEIGIKEKVVKIEMSHMPAVSLVPAGMHRVNPKGQGKKSKFNQKRREKAETVEGVPQNEQEPGQENLNGEDESIATHSKAKKAGISVLAFKPRGVDRRPKLAISSEK
ncbi:hypothetical protein FisN_21Lh053 [Fistulifera solaris]|uniref:RRM domain-containing protein n=1 Tax=Fistulifera solaris TaxID=1519565 RepID=A0A1Z5KKX7_FISSO|nr:hypothetical protein FisN_21Lh053 [Fistulifera solaris]|eukprot:GAX26588.1 hypothetical protein FisN_21Lh053 [Fistulifera solaris]